MKQQVFDMKFGWYRLGTNRSSDTLDAFWRIPIWNEILPKIQMGWDLLLMVLSTIDTAMLCVCKGNYLSTFHVLFEDFLALLNPKDFPYQQIIAYFCEDWETSSRDSLGFALKQGGRCFKTGCSWHYSQSHNVATIGLWFCNNPFMMMACNNVYFHMSTIIFSKISTLRYLGTFGTFVYFW